MTSAFFETQMNGYEKFWNSVRVEKRLIKCTIALNLKFIGISPDEITATGLSIEEIAEL